MCCHVYLDRLYDWAVKTADLTSGSPKCLLYRRIKYTDRWFWWPSWCEEERHSGLSWERVSSIWVKRRSPTTHLHRASMSPTNWWKAYHWKHSMPEQVGIFFMIISYYVMHHCLFVPISDWPSLFIYVNVQPHAWLQDAPQWRITIRVPDLLIPGLYFGAWGDFGRGGVTLIYFSHLSLIWYWT